MSIKTPYEPYEDFMIENENLLALDELGRRHGFFDDDEIEFFKEASKFESVKKDLDEGALPDPYDIDSLFISFFVVEGQILEDFPWVIQEFYRHEADHIESFSKIDYAQTVNRELSGAARICRDGLNLIFNAYRDGNEYAKITLQNLYKTYYRAEYRSFKRYDTMDYTGIYNLAGEGEELDLDMIKAARIIIMCHVFEKQIDDSVYYMFPLISEYGRGFIDFVNRRSEWPVPDKDMIKASGESLKELFEFKRTRKGKKLFDALTLYSSDLIKREGYYEFGGPGPGDCYISMGIAKSLFLAEKCREEFSLREWMIISVLSQKICELCGEAEERDDFIENMLLGIRSNEVKYRPPKVEMKQNDSKQAPIIMRRDPAEDQDALLKNYAQEVDRLQRELRLCKQEMAHYRQQFEKMKDELAVEQAVSETMKEYQAELYSLRNYVYSLSEEDIAEDKRSTEELIELMKGKKVLVIGGHPNWTYKFRNIFPEWRFVSATVSGSVDPGAMNKLDCVLFFTDIISHSVYNKYITLAREKKVPFGYLHATNVDASVREMARAVLADDYK